MKNNDNLEKEYNGWENLKKAFSYAKKQKKILFLFFLTVIINCIIGAIAPLLSARQLLYMTDGLLNQVLHVSIFILSIEVIRNFVYFFGRKFGQLFHREVMKHLQLDIAREVLKIETSELDKHSSGAIISRLTNDTGRISDIFIQLNFSLSEFVTNIGILFAILVINKYLFLYYLVALLIIFYLEKVRINKYNKLDKQYRKTAEKTTGLVGELVRGVRDIKVLNAGKAFLINLYTKIDEMNQERYRMSTVTRSFGALVDCVRDTLDFLLIVLFIIMIKNNLLSVANAVVVYMYRHRVFNLLTVFSSLLESYKDFNLSAGRVFDIIGNDTYKKEKFGKKHINKIKGDFEFKDVWFSYSDKEPVLKGINFKIKHNSTVSFVGKSGAGKSTIFSLLAKLYEVDKGDILIDGISINELDEDSIRGNISIITQSPYIFNMTIRENLEVVKEGLTEEEMIKACKLACLHDFIMELPDGYDTLVGEGGLTLSGGQRQRLAIARALVQNTEIILFDEATSALDNETQQSIQDAINNMKNEYTILIIAHRLSTVINSDKIMMIDDGTVVASGSHEELLKSNKDYKSLYNYELKKNQD